MGNIIIIVQFGAVKGGCGGGGITTAAAVETAPAEAAGQLHWVL